MRAVVFLSAHKRFIPTLPSPPPARLCLKKHAMWMRTLTITSLMALHVGEWKCNKAQVYAAESDVSAKMCYMLLRWSREVTESCTADDPSM